MPASVVNASAVRRTAAVLKAEYFLRLLSEDPHRYTPEELEAISASLLVNFPRAGDLHASSLMYPAMWGSVFLEHPEVDGQPCDVFGQKLKASSPPVGQE